MKKLKNRFTAGILTSLAVIFTLSSCQKAFNTKSYAPTKPAPTFSGYSASSQIEADSLIDYWNFSSTLTDSISKLSGTASGSNFAAGISGDAYQGANNSYALCQSSPAMAKLTQFTVSAWINTTPPTPTSGLYDWFTLSNTATFWGNIEMFFDNGSDNTDAHVRIHMNQNGNDNTFAAEVPGCFNTWVNLIFSYNQNGTCTLYLNGASVATGTAGSMTGSMAFENVGKVVFGCNQFMTTPAQTSGGPGLPLPTWSGYWPGKIDQVRVYSKVLSAQEASALYNLENLHR